MASAVTGARVQPQFGRVGSSLRDQRPGVAVPSRGSAVQVEAAKKKGGTKRQDIRVTITLECTEQRGTGTKGISRYTTEKNRRKTPDRIELMKYNKFLGRHTLHREIKAKK